MAEQEYLDPEQIKERGTTNFRRNIEGLIEQYIYTLGLPAHPLDNDLRAYMRNRIADLTGIDTETIQVSCELISAQRKDARAPRIPADPYSGIPAQ